LKEKSWNNQELRTRVQKQGIYKNGETKMYG